MDGNSNLPDYAQLFGQLDFKQGDEARSVYSPAAYLADLLQLLEDMLGTVPLTAEERRPDIQDVLLDAENTFTELPYLDTVNNVLETAIFKKLDDQQKTVYDELKEAKYPFQMPFDLDNEKLKKYLHYLDISAEQIYKHFAVQPDFDRVAREYLGLSQAEYHAITAQSSAESEIKAFYQLSDDQSWAELISIGTFLKTTSLSGPALRELLFQHLSQSATDPATRQVERSHAVALFIHDRLGGYVTLDQDETTLVWSDSSAAIPVAWFERVSRFVRLANKSGLSFSDLDLILRSCCHNQLDAAAIRTIAVIKQLHDHYELPVDVACSLVRPINTLGIGDDKTPQDLFNRVFNVKFADIDKAYIAGASFIPARYATSGYTRLACAGDILSFNNKEYRRRLSKALLLSERDLTFIVTQFRGKYAADPGTNLLSPEAAIGVPALSLLHRITRLAEVLDISYAELFGLLDLLEHDPSIRKANNFDLLIQSDVQTLDCYRILQAGDVSDALWLVQMLFAVVQWIQAGDFTSDELNQILSGRYNSTAEATNRSQKLAALDNLYQQFKTVMLTADLFVSDRFSARAARLIHHVLTEQGNGLVCKQDHRLLRFDAALAATVAYQALDQLGVLRKEDFQQLGLEQKLLDKIFANLIIKGYLTAEGEIVESMLPKDAAEFVLTSDFRAHADPVFTLIHDFYIAAQAETIDAGEDLDEELDDEELDDGERDEDEPDDAELDDELDDELDEQEVGEQIEVAFFPSDLEAVAGLSEAQSNELYDNLIFNGYIDAEGNVLQTDFFAVPENAAAFQINADLSAVATSVFRHLIRQIERFEATPLALDTTIFEELGLTPAKIEDLVENLKFNEYIGQANVLINKRALLAVPVDQFNLGLDFYPERRRILAAIKNQINAWKSDFYTVSQESLGEIADAAVAQQVLSRLTARYLSNNRIAEEQKAFFLDRDNLVSFALGADLSPSDHELVFDQIARILADQQKYQLPLDALADLDFDAIETAELLATLINAGNLTDALMLPVDKIPYFLNINNALEFSITAFTDYNKDIFFILHAMAKESAAAIDEIVAKISEQAGNQARVVFEALQEAFAVEVDLIQVVCRYLLGGLDHVVEAFMLPILAQVDINDTVATEPDNSRFNLIYKRLLQWSLLATKLRLSAEEAEIAWRDQDLAEKFPEKLALPTGVDRFDALLETPEGVIYLIKDNRYWAYSATKYHQLETADHLLSSLSDRFAGLDNIDAAFADSDGTCWIVAGDTCFAREKGSTRWVKKARRWGQIKSNFEDPAKIDTAFQDQQGKTYLFAGTQYIRYSGDDYTTIDEGYPRTIAGNWEKEGLNAQLPSQFKKSIDSSFQGTDGKTYLFKNNQYVSSDALSLPLEIRARWGKVRNKFQGLVSLDAAYSDGADYYFFADDQVSMYRDSIENDRVSVCEGYPQRIEARFANLPAEFERGLEAAFKGADGRVHLFKDGKTVAWKPGSVTPRMVPVKERWGVVSNALLQTGKVDAAFVGLDGKTYLFSDDQYVRYSSADYAQVDEGYPRTIAGDWGGLHKVDAAFVLNGKTYLFGTDPAGKIVYVRYSKKDYQAHDEGYPKAPNDNWWNLPAKLVQDGAAFERIDAVFCGKDSYTYLFSGDQFIAFDNKHRWWSEPQPLRTHWDSIPFAEVDAAFVGKDGKTYIFSGKQYIRYSSSSYSKIDDRYPNDTSTYWGNVVNNIAKTGRVDAALVVESRELIDGVARSTLHTYLFSGNQYVRYAGDQYTTVESGYPKYIATSLRTEPRFKNLTTTFENGIDAALADRRTIYLFKGSRCYALSESISAVYDQPGSASCAFLEDGSLMIAEGESWQRYSALEGTTVVKAAAVPATLRGVPATFKQGLDAVLQGLDRNTYLFKGSSCFNVLLNKEYPLAEEWGRPKNNIYLHNTVDAAFVGPDNKTYLFSGDQFFTYSATTYTGTEIDEHPKRIHEHWGGLTSVKLAYVQDQQTYLFEKPDHNGNFRYVRYSTSDYSQPDAGFPQTADMGFWLIPDSYREEGFDEVGAVLVDGKNVLLLSHNQFIQYNDQTGLWSYPRPLSRIWRDFPLDKLAFPGVKTAFIGADGATYFFAEETYVCYSNQAFTRPAPIKESWGLMRNNFVNNRNGNRVDAAVVYQSTITYLFSGDQYVRYSGPDYRYVDAGYPKPLPGNLRQEEGFKNLPAAFEDVLLDRIASQAEPVISAVIANGRTLSLLLGDHWHVASQSLAATYDLSIIGRVKNHLVDQNRVDASFVGHAGNGYRPTFLFSGDQYVRYSTDDYTYVDDGYPRSIAAAFAAEMGVAALPEAFDEGLDAALYGADGSIYLFKDRQYLKLGEATPRLIKDRWGKVHNLFAAAPADRPVDAAFIAPGGGFYAFKDSQYVRYQSVEQEYVDEGYPKAIKDNWGNLPVEFEAAIDGAFVFEGRTYLLKGDTYVRYSDSSYGAIDSIYPQAFIYRWGDWADYLLSDIKIIARFKALQDAYSTADGSLAEFLNPPPEVIKTPFELLAAIFGWDLDEIKWLKRHNGFLSDDHLFEEQFQLEMIIKIFDIFATAQKIGAAPSDLFTNVWQPLYTANQPQPAAQTLYRYLAQSHSEQDWQVLSRQIHNELNLIKRDALIGKLIAYGDDIEHARDLYERFLIDVEMGSSGVTSRIQEAIAATQLYFHRYFVNLERVDSNGTDAAARRSLKSWWKWMKNYRVWEANRKVFLYPENYIRPELRDTKTPAFKTLEEDLLQGEITPATVQRSYKKYLDEYTEVSRLTIAGGYVYQPAELDAPSRKLVLFGRTKTDPRRYYYRLGEFLSDSGSSALWTPWLSVNVQIDADTVYPVFAFARVFVFWARAEAVARTAPTTALTTTQNGTTQTVSSNTPTTYVIKIYYSFYNLNKEWVPAQTLTADITLVGTIDDLKAFNSNLKLFVDNSDNLNIQGQQTTHENIVVNCAYSVNNVETNTAFYLTPELYTVAAARPNFTNRGEELFHQIFDEPRISRAPGDQPTGGQATVHAADVVMFNTLEKSSDGPWFSFDYKGGSFLCKPAAPPLDKNVWSHSLTKNSDRLPQWPHIDAAVTAADGKSYFFSNASSSYVESSALDTAQPTKARWGHVHNNVADKGVVDAALVLNQKTYFFSGNQYLTFSDGLELADYGCPKTLSNNADGLPKWKQIHAAFTGLDGKSYFFNNQTKQFVTMTPGQPNSTALVIEHWGKMAVSSMPVVTAFSIGDYTYLAYSNQYVRYTGSAYNSPDPDYPQPFTGLTELAELQHAKRASSIEADKLAVIFCVKNSIYFQYTGESQLQQIAITSGPDADRENFSKHLNDDELTAVTIKGSRIYAFKRKVDSKKLFTTLCVYNTALKDGEPKDGKKKADKAGEQDGKWEYHTIGIVDARDNPITIDHALVGKDGTCYLFAGSAYMRCADWIELIEKRDGGEPLIRWTPEPGTIAKDWLRINNRIAETGLVDAAFVSGNFTYLVSGDQYIRYTGTTYDLIDEGYPRSVHGNDERLPEWDELGAVFKAADGTLFFFDNRDQTYVEAGNLTNKLPTRPRWGVIRNNFTVSGAVDAAYVRDGALYLTSGNQFVRYTQTGGKGPGDFVDAGYPKDLTFGALDSGRIDAAFTLGDYLYVFAGDRYFKLPPALDLDTLPRPQFIQGNWGNLPYTLRSGLDAAFQRDGTLFLFKADQYACYSGNISLYEIAEAKFDIIRLTTSTAYKLNQQLFVGGVAALLNLNTQKFDESPAFSDAESTATCIKFRPGKVNQQTLPVSTNLDFASANGIYYWEIFFHAPFLIAQALNTGQKFEEAKQWYEYIFDPTEFDPTEPAPYWRFLPFQARDPQTLDDLTDDAQIKTYLNDPFDPHAIAALRTTAYRKAIVMAYVDNLLDWGDLLFRQYTRESINESRMLYILAYDLLGEKPQNLGTRLLPAPTSYRGLRNKSATYDLTLYLPGPDVVGSEAMAIISGTPHESVGNPYFFVPDNSLFSDYWTRVEDRLYKIRHSLNILGISQPLPLFEPPIDPMALVQAVSSGAALSSALSSLNIPVPHYRFSFMLRKAQDLVQKLNGFGNDLLGALEKKDAEELSLLQNRQEAVILSLTRAIKEAQVKVAEETVKELEASLQGAKDRVEHYTGLIAEGLLPIEEAQIGLMISAATAHMVASGLKLGAAIAQALPQVKVGPFIIGTEVGGEQLGEALGKVSEFSESLGEGLSVIGEVLGTYASHMRTVQDWTLQLSTAQNDAIQIGYQLEGARLQQQIAQRELEIQEQEIAHNAAIKTFMQGKFTNAQLYQWMIGKLSGLYFQTYSMAYDMARAAQKAFQFERGLKENEVNYIQPLYWDSQKNGLLAGESLGLDLDRMEKAFIDGNSRGFEITRQISLLELDPMALLQLKSKGVCEFSLPETLFDYDFPGHYRRQIKTVSLAFVAAEGQRLRVNATLTQLNHKTVLEPDAKAVKYLLDPKDQPPLSLRSDWRPSQQIALSHVGDDEENNGLFELRYDDERYFPFEGTGAVSAWRLELNGKKSAYNVNDLLDVTITLKYTAEQGGAVFATAVKGMLKPYPTARFFDVASEFPDEWEAFLESEDDDLVLTLSRDMFPNMSSSKITGLFAHYELTAPGTVSMVLNDDKDLTLKDGKFLSTSGLSISSQGSEWVLALKGSIELLQNIGLVVGYKANVT